MRLSLRSALWVGTLSLLCPLSAGAADTPKPALESHWYIAPFVGYTSFDSEWGKSTMQNPAVGVDDNMNYGGRFGYMWGSGFGLEAAGGYTSTTVRDGNTAATADLTYLHFSANLLYHFFLGKMGGPFLSGGFGTANNKLGNVAPAGGVAFTGNTDKLDEGVLDMAVGWIFPFSDALALRLEARNLLWTPKDDVTAANASNKVYGAALAFNFGGKPKDSDADGVPDKNDKCASTPTGALVDATGCPTDADKDGVFDGLDRCPQTPHGATVNAEGCPSDTDKDGVFDGVDKCANTPVGATVDASGCPSDTDNDGVVDGIDQCANTPTGAKVDEKGCPMDTDRDGVPDGLDKCEGTPDSVRVDKDGCPIEISERETQFLETGLIRLNDVNFATGKAVLMESSYPSLNQVGGLLENWPQLKIEIGGHTDSQGAAAANQKLSLDRAAAVEKYLLEHFKGLTDAQFTVKGYGEAKPLVPNTSKASMAKNRRVEFKVLNTDVLKKEVERRKLLQK